MANPNWLFFIGSTTTAVQPRPEVITPDKWLSGEVVNFGRSAARVGAVCVIAACTALAFVAPVVTVAPETVTVDKWHPEANRPRFDLRRAQYESPSYFTADRQPEPRIDSWWQQANEFLRQPDRRMLRFGASEFALTPAQNIERTTPDKYWQQPSVPRWDVRRAQYGPQAYAAPDRQQVPDLDSWVPATNLRLFDQKRTQYSYPYYGSADQQQVPDSDSWWQQPNQPRFDLRRAQYTYPSYAAADRRASPSVVQTSSTNAFTSVPVTCAFPADCTTGNALLVFINCASQSKTFTVSDTLGNTWIPAADQNLYSNNALYASQFWYVKSCLSSGPNTVSVSYGGGGVNTAIVIAEISGCDPVDPLDQYADNTPAVGSTFNPGDIFTSASVTPNEDGELIWCAIAWDFGSAMSAGTGYTPLDLTTGTGLPRIRDEYRTQSESESINGTVTAVASGAGTAGTFGMSIASFRAPGISVTLPDKWAAVHPDRCFDKDRRMQRPTDAAAPATIPSEQIFAEKWHPELQRCVYDVARRQFGFPSLAVPERQPVPLALAYIQSSDPRFDLKRAQYTNPWFSTADRQQLPDLDSWVPAANQPQFDLKRSQFLAARSEWASTFTANRVFPDSWHPEVKSPQFDLRRTQYLDPSEFSPDRQSEPRLDSWWQQLSEAVRLPDRRVQGQGFTILGVPPAEDVEEISPDRWQPLTNQPLFDKQRTQYLLARTEWTSTFTANRVFPDSWYVNVEQPRFDSKRTQFLAARTEWVSTFVANRVFPDSWHPESNKPQFDAKRIQAPYPAFTGADRQSEPRLDSWWQLPGQPQFDLRRSQFLPPSSVEPDRQSQPRVDSWWQQAQEFLRQPDRRVLRLGASELDLTPAQDVERTSVDKYYPSIQQPQFDKRRSQYGFTFTFFYPQPYASPIFADSWHPLTGQPLFDRDRRVQRLGDSELTLSANQEPERTTPDKWHPAIEKPQFDKRRQQSGYPAYFAPERQADVRFDSWWQRTSELIPSREFRIQAFENGGLPFTPRAIFVDSWWQQTNERLLRAPSRLYLADFFTSGTTSAERTSIDKYDPGTERPQFDLARKQYLAQTFAFSERQTEPRFDSWYQPLSEAVRRNDWRQYDAPSLGEPEREPEITDWLLQASEPLRKQRGSVEGVQGVPFTPERISIDKWYATVLDPSGRHARFFLYPSYFSPERQSTPRTESWYIAVGEPQRILARRLSENAALPITSTSETSVDEWHPAANQPLFSVSRTQHGYLVTSLPTAPPVPSRPGIVLISSSTARVLAGSELIDTLTSGSTGPGIAISSKVKGTVEASSEVADIRIKSEPQH